MKKNKTQNQKVIIINNTYTGSYGQNQNNLPHEMINFFRADDDLGYYIYITPSGTINSKIKKEDIEGIIFIRSIGNGLVEVLGKAELGNNSEFYTQGLSLNKKSDISSVDGSKSKTIISERKELLKNVNETIKYGKKSLMQIHQNNATDNNILVSIKVDKICLPKKTFYLTYRADNKELLNDIYFLPANDGESDGKKIANESMLAYYYEKDNGAAYNILKNDVLDSDNLWKHENETPKYDPHEIDDTIMEGNNFFKITRQQDNEVMFSNMFYYYFSNHPELLKYFVKNCLKIDNLTKKYTVEREKERMDIRIIDDNNYIIIENKIKSGINGIKKKNIKNNGEDDHNQRVKYRYNANNIAVDDENKYISQLSDYWEKAETYLEKERNNGNKSSTEIKAFIFVPNYSPLTKELLDEKYSRGNEYKIISYEDIEKTLNSYKGVKPPYFQDFLYALKKHTKQIDDEHRLNLLYRLKCRIENIK